MKKKILAPNETMRPIQIGLAEIERKCKTAKIDQTPQYNSVFILITLSRLFYNVLYRHVTKFKNMFYSKFKVPGPKEAHD